MQPVELVEKPYCLLVNMLLVYCAVHSKAVAMHHTAKPSHMRHTAEVESCIQSASSLQHQGPRCDITLADTYAVCCCCVTICRNGTRMEDPWLVTRASAEYAGQHTASTATGDLQLLQPGLSVVSVALLSTCAGARSCHRCCHRCCVVTLSAHQCCIQNVNQVIICLLLCSLVDFVVGLRWGMA
jgi:hypothetical protein